MTSDSKGCLAPSPMEAASKPAGQTPLTGLGLPTPARGPTLPANL
eukprot:CAMPEP_0195132476 /NCGR_PEP_ID=MMETSP0448-20130528/146995_1 /TAXON_ID=66468 /ORGANISM="Heterocapsa triquestra, Strain CCMP 448" /LENGTH=44 /DNA_ID= /DNA_START= /DNA_END= /DNA_ORIENTATION=